MARSTARIEVLGPAQSPGAQEQDIWNLCLCYRTLAQMLRMSPCKTPPRFEAFGGKSGKGMPADEPECARAL